MPVPDSAEVREWSALLAEHAELMAAARPGMMDGVSVPPAALSLRRSFSRGSLRLGGRFYGTATNWPADDGEHEGRPFYRGLLTFGGELTVEPDLSALHPRILMARAGISDCGPDFAPYAVSDGRRAIPKARAKHALSSLINADRATIARALKEKPVGDWARMYHSAALAPIRPWLGSGAGLALQYSDSVLTLAVLQRLVRKGSPVFPVHDSFRVRLGDLGELMEGLAEGARALSRNEQGVRLVLYAKLAGECERVA